MIIEKAEKSWRGLRKWLFVIGSSATYSTHQLEKIGLHFEREALFI